MNIAVLCGGLSPERDVSITSGTKATAALRRRGHRVFFVDLFLGYPGIIENPLELFTTRQSDDTAHVSETAPDLERLLRSRAESDTARMGPNVLEICKAADIVFMALHGSDGEDGKVQATFDLLGIRYTGTGSFASMIAMNKEFTKIIFEKHGISTPGYTAVTPQKNLVDIPYPRVVKPVNGGSSIGVSIVHDDHEYAEALTEAFKYDATALVEPFVSGRECSVGVIAGAALPVIEIVPHSGFYDYKNKYQGLTDEPCPADFPESVTAKLQKAAVEVFEILQLEAYARMDFIVDAAENIWCLEANTLPGLTPTSLLPQEAAVIGITYDDLCERIIEESMKKYKGTSR